MIETSSVPPRKSSVIFGKSPGNVRKRLPYFRNNFGKSSEIFGKWSEIFRKSSKTSSLVCLCNKQNITCPLVDMNFIFSCSTRHLTSERSERVRYQVEHSKIKFISTRGHVIFSLSFYHFTLVTEDPPPPWKTPNVTGVSSIKIIYVFLFIYIIPFIYNKLSIQLFV